MRGPDAEATARARRLRRSATEAEKRLWQVLRARRLAGFKFVRQIPIGRYTVDFVCRERRLIIEVDGGQHASSKRDAGRDRWLAEQGYRVLRFWNNEVLENLEGVVDVIADGLRVGKTPHPDR